MPERIRVACVQLTAGADKAANIEQAERLVARAAATGADLVLLPEKWNGVGNAERNSGSSPATFSTRGCRTGAGRKRS